MAFREKILSLFKTSASKEITYFAVLLFSVLTLPVIIAAAVQPVYKSSQAIDVCPKLLTSSLPTGVVGQEYNAIVSVINYAGSAGLEMSFSGLPPGLSQGICWGEGTSIGPATISCKIVGTPESAGDFIIQVKIRDQSCPIAISAPLPIKIISCEDECTIVTSETDPQDIGPGGCPEGYTCLAISAPPECYPKDWLLRCVPVLTPTPTPTSSPEILNNPPEIVTEELPDGVRGGWYEAAVKAVDKDGDNLTMGVYNLSPYLSGLSLNPNGCMSYMTPQGTALTCHLRGYFLHPDVAKHNPYRINFIAEDSHGAKGQRYLTLYVHPIGWTPSPSPTPINTPIPTMMPFPSPTPVAAPSWWQFWRNIF